MTVGYHAVVDRRLCNWHRCNMAGAFARRISNVLPCCVYRTAVIQGLIVPVAPPLWMDVPSAEAPAFAGMT